MKCMLFVLNKNRLIKAILMSAHNIHRNQKDIPKFYPIASWPSVIINPQWLELSMYSTN